jgi:hypothetical protein
VPLVTQPDLIEQSDFTGGWAPDGLAEATDASTLLDVSNVLLDRNTGALAVRKGFRRLREELGVTLGDDHYIRQLYHWPSPGSDNDNFIICVVTNGQAEVNNVQLWAISVEAGSVERIDNGTTWANPKQMFWFLGIDGLLYGGSKGNGMFTWDGTGDITEDVHIGTFKEWVSDTGGSVNTANEYGKDYAWKGSEMTWLGTEDKVYMPDKKIRFDEWEDGQRYRSGDRVSAKSDGYWKSYRCVEAHLSDSGDNKPDTGTDWNDFWKRVTLPKPKNEDNETSDSWVRVPLAAKTSIAAWHASRLFLRFDGQGNNSRLQFSAPVKPDKGEDIPDVSFDPTDFAPGNDFRGNGGGWIDFNDGKHQGPISALHPFGQYLIVFKRRSTWVLSGEDNASWTVRRVARGVGAIGQQCHVEMDGLVYFLSDDGLYATDGTAVEPVEGDEKTRLYIKERLDGLMQQVVTDNHQPQLFKHNGFIGVVLNDISDSTQNVTLFYDPETGSWWKTDLPVLDWIGYRDRGVEKAAFVKAPQSGAGQPRDLVYLYDHVNAGNADDTGADTYATTPIAWHLKTAWFSFGTHREERRIRRVWAVVKGAATYTLKAYRNYSTTEEFSTARVVSGSDAQHIEGLVTKDAHAIQLRLSGVVGGLSIFGTAIDTQRRRKRYHT